MDYTISNCFSIALVGGLVVLSLFHFISYLMGKRDRTNLFGSIGSLSLAFILCFGGVSTVFYEQGLSMVGLIAIRRLDWLALTTYIVMMEFMFVYSCGKVEHNKNFIIIDISCIVIIDFLFMLVPPEMFKLFRNLFYLANIALQIYIFIKMLNAVNKSASHNLLENRILLAVFLIFSLFIIYAIASDFRNHEDSWKDFFIAFIFLFLLSFNIIAKGLTHKHDNQIVNTSSNSSEINELKAKIEELEHSNTSKNRFLSIIAHDLRNPIASIKTLSEIYLDEAYAESDDHRIELADILSESIDNLFKLLENLLTWSRTQNGTIKFQPTKLAVSEVMSQLIYSVDSVLQSKNIELKQEINGDKVIKADSNMLQTILRNLVTNAIKFSYSGSTIDILFDTSDNSNIIKVTDHGVGMSEEVRNRLFKIDKVSSSYGTNKESGTGLGLIICNEFVHKHLGTITVDSAEGVGTSITITLPK